MNENIDLTEILKGCPKGTKLYSSVYGEVCFKRIDLDAKAYPIITMSCDDSAISFHRYSRNGRIWDNVGECAIFPSKDQRDWSKFERFWDKPKVEKFNPKTLNPYEKVLVKYSLDCDFDWGCDLFSHIDNKDDEFPYHCVGTNYRYCIPYNNETKYLVGTNKEAPEYYRYWEE